MRIFVGIKIDSSLLKRISDWEYSYKIGFPVRFIDVRNLHITLIPPWIEEKSNIKSIISGINLTLTDIRPFFIEFSKIKLGPDKKKPCLIWAEGKNNTEILNLKKTIEKSINIKPEKRKFKLHLTLAKFRNIKSDIKKLCQNVKWRQNVKSFCLFESILSSEGAYYRIIKEFKLTSNSGA